MKLLKIAILLMLIPGVFATGFKNYDIVYDASIQKITINAEIMLEEAVSGLDFSVFTKPKNLNIKSSHPIEYRLDENNIEINFLQPTSGNVSFTIEFETNLIDKLEDRNIFSLSFIAPLDIETFNMKVLLPESSQVFYKDSNPLVSPSPVIETDGKRIILSWERSLQQGESFSTVTAYTKPQEERSLVPIILFFTIVTLGTTFITWKQFEKRSHKPILSAMSEDERRIFNLIKSHKGITQEELRNKTGYSKSKISKLITNLEKMDVIKKTPYKKTNKLESKL